MPANPLNEDELTVIETLVVRHNFPGVCAGLAACCSIWKTQVADDAEKEILGALESFFEHAAHETKLLCMAARGLRDVMDAFEYLHRYKATLEGTDAPEIRPEQKPPTQGETDAAKE